MTQPATIADFQAQFDRNFPFGTGLDKVRDADITKAFNQADTMFNAAIWETPAVAKLAYLLLAAHVLDRNIQDAGGLSSDGIPGGVDSQGSGLIQSKSVGSASVTYQHSAALAEDPILSPFLRTGYGQQYVEMARPRLMGAGFVVEGWIDGDQ